MSPLDRLRRQLDEQDAQEWEAWRERKQERDRAQRDHAIDRLLGAVQGRAKPGRMLGIEAIRDDPGCVPRPAAGSTSG